MSEGEQQQASGGEFFTQSGVFINNQIQILYDASCTQLSKAHFAHYRGIEGQKRENAYRRVGLEAFEVLITKSINLPDVENKLNKVKEDVKGFTDFFDLQEKIATADKERVPTSTVLRWWKAYTSVLVEVGLIKLFSWSDSPYKRW